MSVPDHISDLKAVYKPFLKYSIGDTLFLVTDQEKKTPMLVTAFELDDVNCNDYFVTWMNAKGEIESEGFPEECLIKQQ